MLKFRRSDGDLGLMALPVKERDFIENWSNILFGLFKKKSPQDPYLEKVATVLHATMRSSMPLQNAYNLALECQGELQGHIARGTFRPGPPPRETVMAYYCLCSMVREAGSGEDKQMVFMISTMAGILASKFKNQSDLTSLEKGICLFGEQTLKSDLTSAPKHDIAEIQSRASDIVFEIANANGAPLSRDNADTLVKNVCANIPETDACKAGEKVLAISSLSSMTAYCIDQDDIELANEYAACVFAAMKKYVEGQMPTFTDYQAQALRTVARDFGSVVEELTQANSRSGAT